MIKKHWYAVYVRSRNEKKVYELIKEKDIETYLPLIKTIRQWSDRKKMVEVPLFNSYVFVKILPANFYQVLAVDGAVKFIKFEGKPAHIPDEQIESLKLLLHSGEKFEVSIEEFETGEMVEVINGPLTGFKGILVRYKNKNRALLHIDSINQTLIINILPSYLRKVKSETK